MGRGRAWAAEYTIIDGVTHKKCHGPFHPEEGEFLPLHRFSWRLKTKANPNKYLRSRCKTCEASKNQHRHRKNVLVPITKYWYVFRELKRHYTDREICRQIGCTPQSLSLWGHVAESRYDTYGHGNFNGLRRSTTGYGKHRWRMRKEFVQRAIILLAQTRKAA